MSKKKSKVVNYPRSTALQLCLFQFDKDNNEVWTPALIQSILDKHSGAYISYSYILHDKDKYDGEACCTQEERRNQAYINYYRIAADSHNFETDETQPTGYIFDGELDKKAHEYAAEHFPVIYPGQSKPSHFHVNVIFSQRRCCDEIARWFGVIPEAVKAFTGRGGTEEAELYLVHQKQTEKYPYDASEVVASFDYVNKLNEHMAKVNRQQAYHQYTEDDVNDLLNDVEAGRIYPDDAKDILTYAIYSKYQTRFENARKSYLSCRKEMPALRRCYYVSEAAEKGKGGLGKSLLSQWFAKELARDYYNAPADLDYNSPEMRKRYIFDTGEAGVALQSYDGQPILVINDVSGTDMLDGFGGRKEIKELLDLHPVRRDKNIKFSKTQVFAEHIIINGIQPFAEFILDIAKGKKNERNEDGVSINQFVRRIWARFQIVDYNSFDILFNRGIFRDNSAETTAWDELRNIRATFDKDFALLGGAAEVKVSRQLLAPVINKLAEYDSTHSDTKITRVEDIPEYMNDYGLDADSVALRNMLRSLDADKLTSEARAYLSSDEVLNKLPASLASLMKTVVNKGDDLETAVNNYVLDSREHSDEHLNAYTAAAEDMSKEVEDWNKNNVKPDIPASEASALMNFCVELNNRLRDVKDDRLIPLASVLLNTVSGLVDVIAPAAGADSLPFAD